MAKAATETRIGFRPARYLQYFRALQTYTSRPVIRWLAAAAVLFAVWYVFTGESRVLRPQRGITGLQSPNFLRLLSFALWPLFILLPAITSAAIARHAREQIVLGRTLLIPRSIAPAMWAWLVAIAVLLAATAAFMLDVYVIDDNISNWTARHRETSFLGVLDVALLLIAMSAWFGFLARSPWSAVLFACVVLTVMSLGLGRWTQWLVERQVYDRAYYALWFPRFLNDALAAESFRSNVRWGLFGAGAGALIALAWRLAVTGRAKTSRRQSVAAKDLRGASTLDVQSPPLTTEPQPPHRPLNGPWQRLLSRRRASALGPAAAWVLGGVVAVLSTLLTLLNDYIVSTQQRGSPIGGDPDGHVVPIRALLLATAVPAIAAAGAWRARRPSLAYESLFPATRAHFARETAAALAADLFTYWLACVVGATISVALTRPQWLTSPLFAAGLFASAAAECLALAGLLFAARSRPLAAHAIGPAAATIAVAALMAGLWPKQWSPQSGYRPIALGVVLLATAITAIVGAALSAVGFWTWRRAELT